MKLLKLLAVSILPLSVLSCGGSYDPITDEDLAKNLTGIWTLDVRDAEKVLTDERVVVEYDYDAGISFRSEAVDWKAEKMYNWEYFVDRRSDPEKTYEYVIHEFVPETSDPSYYSSIGRISSNDLIVVVMNDSPVSESKVKYLDEFHRTTTSFESAIIGSWQGVDSRDASVTEVYNHIWEFKADGTFVFYTLNEKEELIVDPSRTNCEYVVAGKWLAMRWKQNDVETVECWDIEVSNDVMNWKAERAMEDVSEPDMEVRYKASIDLRKVIL